MAEAGGPAAAPPLAATLVARLHEILRASPRLMAVLRAARELDLPDWLVFSGLSTNRC